MGRALGQALGLAPGPQGVSKIPPGPGGDNYPHGPKTLGNLRFPHRDRKNKLKTHVFRMAIAKNIGTFRF